MATINGTDGSDWLPGTAGDDVINGFGASDSLYGDTGVNFLNGGDGDDNIVGGPGTDHLDGGAGADLASYQLSSGPVNVSIDNPGTNTGDAAGDTYTSIEGITGSPFGGTYSAPNNGQNFQLWGLDGTNNLLGANGYATIISGPGADRMVGGLGRGLVDYEVARAGLTASLLDQSINTGEAKGDTYQSLWDIAGSAFDDTLIGDRNNNNFLGNGGNDVMSTGAGNDTLNGGPGADTLTGGSGSDWFVFGGPFIIYDPSKLPNPPFSHSHPLAVMDEGKSGIFDRIIDFNRGNSGSFDVTESDSLHVAQLVSGIYNRGNGPPASSLVRLVEDASNTFALFQVDIDGAGSEPWVTLARVDGLRVGDLVNVILDGGSPVVQISVGGLPPLPPPPPAVHLDAWLLSNGRWAASVDPGSHPIGFQVSGIGDFNHDGTSDLLWFNPTTNAVDLWMLADGKWTASSDVGRHPAGYNIAGIGDFNADGNSDVLWVNPNTNETDIWRLADGQWAGSTTIGAHPLGYQVAGIGDMNHDGTSDVVWFNPNNGDVDIWKVEDGKWAGSTNAGQHPTGYQVSGVGDFNRDGHADIFFYNPATGATDIWMLVNGQWTASVSAGNHPTGYQVGGIGDFNNDGFSDVLWYNPASQQIDEWQLVNGQWAASVDIGRHGGTIAGIGDFNGNGTSDVLWNV